jgi:MFS family permease
LTGALWRYLRSFTGFSRDARIFLLTTIVFGSAQSLFWIDFNLYLSAINVDPPTIGWLMAVQQLAGVAVALPASSLANRYGRRTVIAAGVALTAVALLAVLPGDVFLIFVGTAAIGAGGMLVGVAQIPFIAEHTRSDERNEYFAVWNAVGFLTGVVAALIGGSLAPWVASTLKLTSSAAPYQVLLAGVAILGLLSLVTVFWLANDRPKSKPEPEKGAGRFGIVIRDRRLFAKMLLPGFLTSLGAGQIIPFLNLFIHQKFSLDLASINVVFAISYLGTAVAIMLQPALAKRFGRIGSIVLVQGSSIPFIIVLGFSPLLWSVVLALAVRNSLMNAGSPIWDAYIMDRVSRAERATLTAGMTLLWSLGWTVAPLYYSLLQASLPFEAAYTVNFITMIATYTVATSLLWKWFHGPDVVHAPDLEARAEAAALALAPETTAPLTDRA